ncbi:F510_1955 family glycosylhydrolase [Zafaria sp. Z1313]|uniref:F510_1955 family glycosylhydrolase n=1 Tax=unclassified Zafaria TaxID=2828765 RepID=UPI002E770B9A|nr:exo-alpha-sialidase [Zafaria sp. J156]MEE1622878.1 exo-alpha-sialidase [Zafaria sp. J156]
MPSSLSLSRMPGTRRGILVAAAAATVLALGLTGCSTAQSPAPSADDAAASEGLAHVHGAYTDPQNGTLLLASHHGLFDATTEPAAKIGPTIDLMGFTADANGTFYASGHPGPGTDLPNPVGLIKSTDGGESWTPLSRQGESDFHALTTTRGGIVGFDGRMRTSADGLEWTLVADAPAPYALAGSPEHDVVLATTEEGLWRSEDGGRTWTLPAGGPVMLTAAFIDNLTVAAVTPGGGVYVSDDAGKTWTKAGQVQRQPSAVTGMRADEGQITVWVVGAEGSTERLDIP